MRLSGRNERSRVGKRGGKVSAQELLNYMNALSAVVLKFTRSVIQPHFSVEFKPPRRESKTFSGKVAGSCVLV